MIVLRAKGIDFEITHITADDKPDWFLEISPHGKVPVYGLMTTFYLSPMPLPNFWTKPWRLDYIRKTRSGVRATELGQTSRLIFAKAINGVNYAKSKVDQVAAMDGARKALARVEEALTRERSNKGPFFNGETLSVVDAAYAPFLMRFSLVEELCKTGLLTEFPEVDAWRQALAGCDIIKGSVVPEFREIFGANLRKRQTYASTLLDAA